MFTLDNFSEKITEKIVERGSDYFLNGAVTYLEEDEDGQWEAEVDGSETYHLDITLKGRTVESYYCDCPYDDDDCKHIVAVLYEMRQRIKERKSQPAAKNSKKLTLASLLDKIDLSELRGFVTEYAASDKTFRQKLELHFADKDDRIDVGQKYSELIAKIVRTHADRGYLGYSESRKVAKELDKIVEMGYQYASNDNYKDALTVAQVLLVELMDLCKESDDSAGDLGGTFFGISELMDTLATSDASLELKEELLEFLAKELQNQDYFNYGDYGYDLLAVIPPIALALGEPDMYLTVLDRLEKKADNFLLQQLKTSRIDFLRSIGRTEEVNQAVEASMDIPQVRQGVVDEALRQKDYRKAKALLGEGIPIAERLNHPGTVHDWEKQLLSIAELEKDTPQIRHFAKKFAFDRQFNLNYYQKWRSTFSATEWEEERKDLIKKKTKEIKDTPNRGFWSSPQKVLFSALSPIFIEEKLWPRLFELVQKDPDFDMLNNVRPYLAKLYPEELTALYLPLLQEWGGRVYDRPAYHSLATQMIAIKKDIPLAAEAIDLLAMSLKENNPRRPAMKEELNAVLRVQ
ncbi:SWIM zinc finger domain-containing protein [Persicitalea sp.]|uniref:SWIM zinc finger family protein n=1 Tax=Persicitalea sp. TaxID=3100273 RepID=UPI003593AD87